MKGLVSLFSLCIQEEVTQVHREDGGHLQARKRASAGTLILSTWFPEL